jgi:hypothetical protein
MNTYSKSHNCAIQVRILEFLPKQGAPLEKLHWRLVELH